MKKHELADQLRQRFESRFSAKVTAMENASQIRRGDVEHLRKRIADVDDDVFIYLTSLSKNDDKFIERYLDVMHYARNALDQVRRLSRMINSASSADEFLADDGEGHPPWPAAN